MAIEAAPIVFDPSGELYANISTLFGFIDACDRVLISDRITALGMMGRGRPSISRSALHLNKSRF